MGENSVKQWFPLTDYDFYAYLTAGMVTIAAIDYTLFTGELVNRTQWTVVQCVFWAAMAYVTGHLVAWLASAVIEHAICRWLLHPPITIITGFAKPRWYAEVPLSWLFAPREYKPYTASHISVIKKAAAKALDLQVNQLSHAEEIFGVAHAHARDDTDAASRMDNFRNQYGFCRNLSFAALLATGLMVWHKIDQPFDMKANTLIAFSAIVAVGMFGRFLKFYAAYSREVMRGFLKVATKEG